MLLFDPDTAGDVTVSYTRDVSGGRHIYAVDRPTGGVWGAQTPLAGPALAWAVTNAEAALIALSPPDDATDISALTPAERAVADGLLRGLSDREIAEARNCSRHTVAKHVTAIYRKLGVRSRTQAALRIPQYASGEPRSADSKEDV